MDLTYDEMQELAKTAHNAVTDYLGEAKAYFDEVEKLQESWQGSDNTAYSNGVLSYRDDIENLGKVCNDYAVYLDDAAVTVSNTQDGIKKAAQQL